MQVFISLFFLLSSLAFAQQEQKVNGKWAYYGADFYAAVSSRQNLTREMFENILNGDHVTTPSKMDVIVPSCNHNTRCYRHVSVGYDSARKIMFGELDILRDRQGTFVLDVYCGKKFYFKDVDSVSNMHDQVNIEHTWPQSRFTKSYPKDMQKSDMHHLYLTDSRANSMRGNSPFGLVGEVDDRMGGEGCRSSRFGLIDSGDVYTPPAPHRGNIARSLFYFALHYKLTISRSEETTLRKWHKEDPVDAAEILRHEKIAEHQKVRNPFVDHPELVERITDF